MFLEAEPRERQSWAESSNDRQLLLEEQQHLEQQRSMGMAEPQQPPLRSISGQL